MIKAKTAKIITKEVCEKIVEDALNRKDIVVEEVIEAMDKLIIGSSETGCNYCNYTFESDFKPSLEEIILTKARPLINQFETAGYKVILSQTVKDKNVDSSTLHLCLYWGELFNEYKDLVCDKGHAKEAEIVYYTTNFSDLNA